MRCLVTAKFMTKSGFTTAQYSSHVYVLLELLTIYAVFDR